MIDVPRDELALVLAEPWDQFVAARTARVKAMKAEGRKDEATALAGVRKPTRLVWTLGEVRRRYPDDVAEADAAADDVEDAQAGAGGSVRAALSQFRDALRTVAARATRVDSSLDEAEVGLAIHAVMADAVARHAWIDGVLLSLPAEGGASVGAGSPRAARATEPSAAPAKRARRQAASDGEPPARPALTVVRSRSEAKAHARERRRSAREAVRAASATLKDAESAERDANDRADDLEDQIDELEQRVDDLRAELQEARATLADRSEARSTASDALDQARADLADVDRE